MKFVMDERIKHRLTGLVVIISIGVIFLPAMMKQSNKRFEENMNISLKLPSKPVPPKVAVPTKRVMFKSVAVAHVEIPKVAERAPVSVIARAEPLSKKPQASLAKVDAPIKPLSRVSQKKQASPPKTVAKAQGTYAVQLASFTKEVNAQLLVARLRSQGYVASYQKSSNKPGALYKVLVGKLNEKTQALTLQKKLASNVNLNGFVVKGVS